MSEPTFFDCIIIGAGAAGLMCAATAGQRGRSVLVLDHANKVGKKILMSGGGRCNFTNLYVEPENFLSSNPHFCKSALSRYTQHDFLQLVEKYQLAYHEKTKGQLFCDNKSHDILQILLAECSQAGVRIQTKTTIDRVEKTDRGFRLQTTDQAYICESLVVATGGLSIPTMGASDFGYRLARQFGLQVHTTDAALVPFTLGKKWLDLAQSLAGLSVDVDVNCGGQSFREALLFTHRGLSGPAILQISNYWHFGEEITVNFLPDDHLPDLIDDWKASGEKASVKNLLGRMLPKRFVVAWLEQLAVELGNKNVQQLSKQDIASFSRIFNAWTQVPAGTEGYRTAEVTRGGVDTNGISSKTFEASTTPNLFFIGEVLDVTGWLGGFNFQWAWASGWCAGQYV